MRARARFRDACVGLLFVSLACADDTPIPPLGETGGSEDGGEPEPPLPGGEDCELNWYGVDGAPVPESIDGPEAFAGSLANYQSRVEFDGLPSPPRTYEPAPVDPSFGRMSFDEFAAQYGEPFGSHWFVGGDQAMTDTDFRATYERLHEQFSSSSSSSEVPVPVPVPVPVATTYAVDDFDATWSSSRKLSLTWCIGRVMPSPFSNHEAHEAHLALLVETVEWATRAWERAGDVNFIHLTEYDSPESQGSGECQPGENGIMLRVRTGPDCTGPCGGKTYEVALPQYEFLDPADVAGTAEIVFGLQRFFWSETEARINALHELGHVMGFTHEHLRWLDEQDEDNDGCQALKDIPRRGLTPPDRSSVMANDFCVGVNKNQPRLSPWDRLSAYYGYTWSRRRSLMMAAESQVDEYAYDGTGRAGILWQKTKSAELQRWTSTGAPGEPIEFSVDTLCADGNSPPCLEPFDDEGRVRPSPASLRGTTSELDVLFNGPGPMLADSIVVNDGVSLDPWNLDLAAYAVPVVGSFAAGIADQVLLYRPGPDDDALLILEDDGATLIPMNYAGYTYPLAGRYRGFEGGGNDIIWYDPQNHEMTSWQWSGSPTFDFVINGPSELGGSGLDKGVEYMPLVGDFNGDELTDIFWYSAGIGADIMWWSQSTQDSLSFAVAATAVNHDYRPFIGDLDGNGTADILWFSPYGEVVQVTSKIWYFSEDETYTSRVLSTHRDYSPYIADFDDDGCSDILWYKPDDPNLESPIWRCLPHERDFACEPPLVTPVGAYPIGFGGAY